MTAADVLIVGAGHAGVQLAAALAKSGSALSVHILGEEPVPPYERPPLSKRLLYGEAGDPVPLRTAEYWRRSPVELRTGTRVVAVDPAARCVRTATGETMGYRSLVWAAGGRAARCGLPGEDLCGVHTLRDVTDLAALRADLIGARTAVVVGGGYIGLEAAAALRRRGIAVTVVEVASRLLARVTGSTVSRFFAALHRSQGVDVRLGVGVEAILGRAAGVPSRDGADVAADRVELGAGRVTGVRLGDGAEVAADVVVIGVGMRPSVAELVEAGARGDGAGLEVDAECRTSLAGVYAIGDCARQPNPWSVSGASMRVESVHNAGQHAAIVARVLSGLPAPDPAPPRFWSTQYGHELKTVGLPDPGDDEVVRGDPARGPFSVLYLRDGVLAAIDTVDRPRDFARAQALVAARWRPVGPLDEEQDLPRVEPVSAGRP